MATEADVLRSVTAILQSGESREQFKVQTALTMMQFAQQKKAQDIEIASTSLSLLQSTNTQLMYDAADNFITNSGLGAFYSHFENKYDKNAIEKATKELQKSKGKGDLGMGSGMSASEAGKIVSAVWWAYGENRDPTGILSIAQEIKNVQDYHIDPTQFAQAPSSGSIRMHAAIGALGFFENETRANRQLASISKLIQNKRDIVEEIFELAKGDTEIQRDIRLLKSMPKPTVDMDKLVKSFQEDQGEDFSDKSSNELDSILDNLNEKRMLSRQGFDSGVSEEEIEKQIKDVAHSLREKHLEEIRSFGEPKEQEVFAALDKLNLDHTAQNIKIMTGRLTMAPPEEVMMGF